jgi:4-amino-4-deoxy-L-arabinose transferase-like glycosyltransferase
VSASRRGPRLAGLTGLIAAAAVMNTVHLAQNGYANIFYSAGVRSMVRSWHNFLFVSFDPGGLVSVDKPPLALWAQALSARVFGFHPLSILLPEALMGIASVGVLYLILVRRFGILAALAGGGALVVFPSFVAVSRANGVDPLLILLMLLACAAAIRASESGRLRELMLSGVLVGLAFNTKTLAAYLVVPPIALAYLVCAPGALPRRILQLLAAGLAMAVVSFAWIALVEATPASKRPYVGSSTDNTQLGLTFEYNGFGRVEGQTGGPGQTTGRPGANVPAARQHEVSSAAQAAHPLPNPPRRTSLPARATARNRYPVPFGGPPGPLRLFGIGLGDQGGWYLPFAFVGLLALLLLLWIEPRSPAAENDLKPAGPAPPQTLRGRRDPRLACALALGGWLVTEAFVLSTSKGIVHPYYISAVAPGAAAMAGVGAVAMARLSTGRTAILGLLATGAAVAGTIAVEVVVMHREHYMIWFVPVLLVLGTLGLGALAIAVLLRSSRLAPGAGIALGVLLALLLVVPTGYAASTWLAPVESTFPAAGPRQTAGQGGIGINPRDEAITLALGHYVERHGGTHPYELLTVASDTAAPFILLGMEVAAVGGYSGSDPALDGPGLARLITRHEARYVLLGGEYSTRGGNGATQAALKLCHELAPAEWSSPVGYPFGLVLFDCAGHERALASS